MAVVGPTENICPGDTLEYHCLSKGAVSFAWTKNGQPVGGNSPDLNLGAVNGGQYTIACTVNFGTYSLKDEKNFNILGSLSPFSATLKQDSFCSGDRAQFIIGQLNSNNQYSIRVRHTGSPDSIYNVLSNVSMLTWQSPVLDSTTVFEFWVKLGYCNQSRKLAEKTVYVAPVPSTAVAAGVIKNPICENTCTTITLSGAEPGIAYQIFSDGVESGIIGTGDTLLSNPLLKSGFLRIKAASSSVCYRFLDDSVAITVMQVEPFFAVSTQYPVLGTVLQVTNNSADSLGFQWSFAFGNNTLYATDQNPAPYPTTVADSGAVTLVAISPRGCKDSLVVPVIVYHPDSLAEYWAFSPGVDVTNNFIPDAAGNIYAANTNGQFINSRLPGYLQNSPPFPAAFFKYDKRGVLQWANRFRTEGTSNARLYIKDMCMDKIGNVYLLMDVLTYLWNQPAAKVFFTSTDGREYSPAQNNVIAIAKYSPSGVFLGISTISNHNTLGCNPMYPALSSISLSIDSSGYLYLVGNTRNACAELVFTDGSGNIANDSVGEGYFVAKMTFEGAMIWAKHYYCHAPYPSLDGYNHEFRPSQVAPDRHGGCYVWASNGPDNISSSSYLVCLSRLSPEGETTWDRVGESDPGGSPQYYFYAHEMVVDKGGNAIVSAAIRGNLYFLGSGKGSFQGNILAKVSPEGTLKWLRNIEIQYSSIDGNNAFGISLEGDKIYLRSSLSVTREAFTLGICFDTIFNQITEYITVWDSLANLIEVITSSTGSSYSNYGPATNAHTIRVRDGIIYVSGLLGPFQTEYLIDQEPIDLMPNFGNYLGRIPDPKRYLPYISRVGRSFFGDYCTFSRCEKDSNNVMSISYLFNNIQWQRDNSPLNGFTERKILPPTIGTYGVTATNTSGNMVAAPQKVQVEAIYDNPEPIITQIGNTLTTGYLPNSVYSWLDSTGTEVYLVYDDSTFLPPSPGYYQVVVRNDNNCKGTSAPLFFKTVSTEDLLSKEISLQIWPNPFTKETSIYYSAPENEWVRISVFNVFGQERRVLLDSKNQSSGTLTLQSGVYNLVSGTYFICLFSSNHVLLTKRVVVLD